MSRIFNLNKYPDLSAPHSLCLPRSTPFFSLKCGFSNTTATAMNRMSLESFANGGRRASIGSQIRNFGGGKAICGGDGDDPLDLFANNTLKSDDDQIKLEKIAAGPGRIGRGMEDLFDSEIGKNDYDWLLTPPETPLYPSAVARESPLSANSLSREVPLSSTVLPATTREITSTGPSGRVTGRSVSNTRPSRVSTSQKDSSLPTRPVRSSSVTRPSISSSYSSSSFSSNSRTSMLNTSSASITSSRSSTPSRSLNRPVSSSTFTARPSSSSTSARPSSSSTSARPSSSSTSARPSTISKSYSAANISRQSSSSSSSRPSSSSNSSSNVRSSTHPINSRVPTPTRTQPNRSSTSTTQSASNSRPSTPNSSRSQTPSTSKIVSRDNSRSSTPTRRPTSSASRIPAINRAPSANSRSSSPSPRPRAPVRSVDLPNLRTDAPPNLRTQLPARSVSAGRTRSGMALTLRSNFGNDVAVQNGVPTGSNKRNYSPPVGSRGRFPGDSPEGSIIKSHGSNDHGLALDNGLRRQAKPVSGTDSTGFGRNISKKSIDMALRHMDIRQGMNALRTSSLFPQSIRSASTKPVPTRKPNPIVPPSTVSPDSRSSVEFSETGNFAQGPIKSLDFTNRDPDELDLLNGSLRYDAFILKEEDSNNMNWLHSAEDSSDRSPVFDHRFEPLPEPFGLL